MLLAALRRLGFLVLLASGVTVAGSLLLGVLLGSGLGRSLSLGFYFMGCFLLISGFFVGNRGPARVKSETAGPSLLPFGMFGERRLRWATPSEQYDTIRSSAVFITVGVVLIVIGAIVDSRQSLF
jgi:hypothetical protein